MEAEAFCAYFPKNKVIMVILSNDSDILARCIMNSLNFELTKLIEESKIYINLYYLLNKLDGITPTIHQNNTHTKQHHTKIHT